MPTLEEDLVDTIDLLSFTFSSDFTQKWSFKYGLRLPRLFQMKLLNSLRTSKPIKLKGLFKFLSVDSGFSPEVIENFLTDIDLEIYSPMICGSLDGLTKD